MSVAVRLVIGEHIPGNDREFPGAGDTGDISVFRFRDFPEEMAERSRMSVEMLSGLREQPACVRAALLGDASVIALVAGLMGGGDESEIAAALFGESKREISPKAARIA